MAELVLAIIITIMVLELRVAGRTDLARPRRCFATFLSYLLSFVYLNHHHMIHLADRVNGAILWANLHLLFWAFADPVQHPVDG
jgi:uncharacterized membrane protein